MGTSGSYGGSGGAWGGAGDDLDAWLDNLPDGPPGQPQADSPDPGLRPVLRGVARGLRGGLGAGGGGGGGGSLGGDGSSSGGGGGSGSTGGWRTSRAAGAVGGRAAAGVAALRAGDVEGLRELGLDPGELDALASDYARAAKIAEAAAEGAPTSIQDEELRRAAAATAIWGLSQPGPPSAVDLVRQFVEEYLYRVVTVEFGSRLRDGSDEGAASLPTEQTLRSTIRGMIRNLPVSEGSTSHVDLGRAIESTYGRLLDIWAADE